MDESDLCPKQVVCYCRFSSTNQTENSIEAQLRAIRMYCKEKKLVLGEAYVDRAKSGRLAAKRPEFLRMISDAKAGKISEIIVHKLDRFGRNSAEVQTYISVLKDYDVKVTSVVEAFDDSPSGKLILQIMSDLNEFFSSNLAVEVMKRLKEKAYGAHFLGGQPNFGYMVTDDKKLDINPNEAPAVRKIYEMFAAGYSYIEISKWLNEHGFKTRAGNDFGKNSLYELVRNEKYKGVYFFNKTAHAKSDGRRNGHQYKDDKDIIRIPGGVPAIVSEELWDKAKARLDAQKQSRLHFKTKHTYLLSGIVYCGECGSAMCGNSHQRNSREYNYLTYRCSKKNNTRGCTNREINSRMLDSFVLSELKKYLNNDNAIKAITVKVNQIIKQRVQEQKESTGRIQKEISKLRISQKNIIEAIASMGISNSLQESLKQTEAQIVEYEAQLSKITGLPDEDITISESSVKACLRDMKAMLKASDIVTIKRFIKDYVDRVTVYRDHVEAVFKLPLPFDTEIVNPELTKVISKTTDHLILDNPA